MEEAEDEEEEEEEEDEDEEEVQNAFDDAVGTIHRSPPVPCCHPAPP